MFTGATTYWPGSQMALVEWGPGVIGTIAVLGMPWIQTAVLGTRPYATSVFDVGSLAGWILLLVSLSGFYTMFKKQLSRFGRAAVGMTAVGMLLITGLLARRGVLFVEAGFRSIPATGEDPAGLLLSTATVSGLVFTIIGAGCIGLALRRIEDYPAATAWLLIFAPILPLGEIVNNLIFDLPIALGRLVVSTNALFVAFGLGWIALGVTVYSRTHFYR